MINENNCQNRREEIAALVLRELEPEAADELKRHIESCKTCKSLYQKLTDEEETIRSAFQAISDKGEVLKSSLIERLHRDNKVTSQADKGPAKTIKIIWRIIMKNPITKMAAAAVVIIAVLVGVFQLGGSMEGVVLANVVENIEQIESFIFQHQISVTAVADGTTIQESETTTYVSSEFGLRQDAYMNDNIIGISYIPTTGTIVTQVMPDMKQYRKVTTSQENMKQIHEQANPKGMIREFLSFEHIKLGRKKIDGIEVEGIEVNDPRFLNSVFESAVGRLWVDLEKVLPVRTEIIGVSGSGSIETKIVAYDFDWDVKLEPGIFEPNVPDDYTLLEK